MTYTIHIAGRPSTAYDGKLLQERNNLRYLLDDIRKRPLLTKQEEYALGKRVQAGEQEAVRSLVEHNLRLVCAVASRSADRGIDLLDLIQEGSVGLWRAAEQFDPDQGRFSTYAVPWIVQKIQRAIYNQRRMIRLPVYAEEQLTKVQRSREDAARQGDIAPSRTKLAAISGMQEERVRELEYAAAAVASLDALVAGEELDLQVELSDPNEDTEQSALSSCSHQELSDAMRAVLTSKEFFVIQQRILFEVPLEQLGRYLKVSRERIRQIEKKALFKLRQSPAVREFAHQRAGEER
jgi:RNA polymerase primary sigma factor